MCLVHYVHYERHMGYNMNNQINLQLHYSTIFLQIKIKWNFYVLGKFRFLELRDLTQVNIFFYFENYRDEQMDVYRLSMKYLRY